MTDSTISNPADNCILLVNKPKGWTSFDVVKKIRGGLRLKKVGHAGTLDPLATGLLVICTGTKTKSISGIQETEKEYTGIMVLGGVTESYDLEKPVSQEFEFRHITLELLKEHAQKFLGEIEQIPPAHSAVKVGGKRAYHIARKGKDPELAARRVTIHEIEILNYNAPEAEFRVVCSKGTYIRTLIHDLGKSVDSGAYLKELCRTRVGEYSIENSLEPDGILLKYRTLQKL